MQIVRVKAFQDVKNGEKIIVGDLLGTVPIKVQKVEQDGDGYAKRLVTAKGIVECDHAAVVLILGEWFS